MLRRICSSVFVAFTVVAGCFCVVSEARASGDLVGHWKFDESSGDAADSSGNNITLTNNGAVTFSEGTQGNAAVFDGGNYFSTSNGPDLANKSFTFSFWIKTSNINGDKDFFCLGCASQVSQAIHLRVLNNGEGMRLGFYANDLDIYIPVSTNQWHHILFIYDKDGALGHGAGYRTAYVDGVQDEAHAQTGVSPFVGGRNLLIGKSPFNPWIGQIDDFRIYSRALLPEEVESIAEGGSGPLNTPTIESVFPADNAVNVSTTANLIVTFSTSTIAASTGAIGIYKASDDSLVESIAVTSPQITKDGAVITIDPGVTFAESTGYYVWIPGTAFKDASDAFYEGTTASTTWNFTTGDFTAPVIDGVSASATASSVSIDWTTDEAASTKVAFGLTGSYGSTTPETDTSPRVTSHSFLLAPLAACTRYHYAAVSRDAAGNSATSSDATFMTGGCEYDAAPISATSTAVDVNGGEASLEEDGKTFTVSVPPNATSTSFVIQVKAVPSSDALRSLGRPAEKPNEVGVTAFDVKAIVDGTTVFDSFDAEVTIEYQYTDEEIVGLDEGTLQLFHYTGGQWAALNDCTVDANANAIACTTPSFSIFALFGNRSVSVSSGARSASGGSIQARVANLLSIGKAAEADALKAQWPWLFSQEQQVRAGGPAVRDLFFGASGDDVRALQTLLISQGYSIPAGATGLFAHQTQSALSRYQAANGIAPAAGYFGPITRAQMKAAGLQGLWW